MNLYFLVEYREDGRKSNFGEKGRFYMIEVENLSYAYRSEDEDGHEILAKPVIDSLNLQIKKGSFVAVLGHNGSGKSTLAKHFNAILLPTGGKVYIDKMDTSDEKLVYDIRKDAGMVFQNPDNQIVAAVVEDEVAFAPENLGVAPEEIRKRVDECLKAVGMSDFSKFSPANLSGGQKQRVAIAAVLAMEPQYIILDEPTAMLDPMGRREVISTIKKLNREKGMTVILITHYMDEAAQADRIVVMNKGKAVMDDVPKEVFKNAEKLKELGLDVPQVTLLTHNLRDMGFDLPDDIIDLDECVDELLKILRKDKND